MGTKRVGLARTQALLENLKREIKGWRTETQYLTTTGNHDLKHLTGDTTVIVNASLVDTKHIRLPEATTANGGMHIRVIFALPPAGKAFIGFKTTKIVGGATSISDATEGHASTNPALKSSAIGTANHRVEVKTDDVARAGGVAGTVLDFYYHGVENQVLYRGNLIGEVDTPTLASHFSTTEVDA